MYLVSKGGQRSKMILESIRLKNIRSYIDEKIVFPEGSILLSGDIGSGKSSILLAVEFALFGLKRGDFSGDSLLRNGENEGYVELCMSLEGKEIVIKRVLKRTKDSIKQDSGFMVIDGAKMDMTPVELKAKVFELLGYPASILSKSKDHIFRFTVYTPQEEMKQILTENPETRLDVLRRIFNIDRYKQIRENCTNYIRDIKSRRAGLSFAISDLDTKKNELQQKRKIIADIEKKIVPEKENLAKMRVDLKAAEKDIAEAEKDIEEYRKMMYESSVLEKKMAEKREESARDEKRMDDILPFIEELNNSIMSIKLPDNIEDDKMIAREVDALVKKVNDAESDSKVIVQKKEMISSRLKDDEKARERLHKAVADAAGTVPPEKFITITEEKMKALKEEISKKKRFSDALSSDEKRIVEIRAEMQRNIAFKDSEDETRKKIKLMDSCPLCLQKVDHVHKSSIDDSALKKIHEFSSKIRQSEDLAKELESKIASSKNGIEKISAYENELVRMTNDLENIKEKIAELDGFEMKIAEGRKELDRTEERIKKLAGIDMSALKREIDEKNTRLENVREQNKRLAEKKSLEKQLVQRNYELSFLKEEIARSKKDIKDTETKKRETDEKLKNMERTEEKFYKAKERYDLLRAEEKTIEIRVVSYQKEKEGIEGQCSLLEEDVIRKTEINRKILKMNAYQSWLEDYFLNTVSTIEKNVMMKIYNEFNELFQRWLGFLIEDSSLTARLDDQFTPIAMQNGYEIDFINLSGGEKQSVALAYRLSLNQVLNSLMHQIKTKDIIILDEPTDGFSAEQLDRIRDVLSELTVKQVLIVSHEPKIESFVDYVVKISKQGHISSISVEQK